MLRKRLYLLAFLTLGIGAVHAWSQPVPNGNNNQSKTQDARPEQNMLQNGVTVVQPKASPQTSARDQPQPKSGRASLIAGFETWGGKLSDPVAIFTGIIAIFTILIFRGDRTDAKKELRAYIAVKGLGVELLNAGSREPSLAKIQIHNVGHIPAREVRWIIYADVDADADRETFDIDDTKIKRTDIVISPTVSSDRYQTFLLTTEKIEAFKHGASLYIWGVVRYNDGFDKPRFTRFCHRYDKHNSTSKGERIIIPATNMRYHQNGNDAD